MKEKQDEWFLEINEADGIGFSESVILQRAADRLYDRAEKLDLEAARLIQENWRMVIKKYELDARKYHYEVHEGCVTRKPKDSMAEE